MRKRFFHVPVFHTHQEEKEKKVTWLELFYDLVYVAAFIQLGDAFSKNISIAYFLKSAGIFTAMWFAWTGFTYYANRYTVDDFLHRFLVIIQMFCVGSMAISIPTLLKGDPIIFGISYACSISVIVLLYLRAYIQQENGRENSVYWGSVFLIVVVFWLLSLFFKEYYYIGWIIGCSVVLLSPMTSKSRQLADYYPFDMEHISERYGLLTIIVLGESFVKVLTELSSSGAGINGILQASFALLLTCSIWWIYFDDIASAHLKKTKNAMVTWLFTHLPLQFSIIIMGVGIKKVIIQPIDSVLPIKYAILLGGAIGTALISSAMIDSVTYRKNSELNETTRFNVRLFSGLMIILLAAVSHSLHNFWFIAACLFVCLFQIVFDIFFSPYDLEEDEAMDPVHIFHKKNEGSGRKNMRNSLKRPPVLKGLPNDFKKDLYFYFVEASWSQLMLALFFIYILSNLFFAGIYLMTPHSISNAANTFSEAFFFSVQTMTTIGYGSLAPNNLYSDIVVSIEAAFGLIGVAIITGLVFAKISRPNAKVLFSDQMIHSNINGEKCLSFRIGNTRGNDIIEANVSLSALIDETTSEGEHIRKVTDLKLIRNRSPYFKLTWFVTHVLNESSPLFNMELTSKNLTSILVTLSGHDGTYSNTIYAQHNYDPEDIVADKYFEDVMHQLPDGRILIDYEKFHKLKA